METDKGTTWAAYVALLKGRSSQVDFATKVGTSQGKISRWLRGKQPPTLAGEAAKFARNLDRNPLEAFVAAGMLSADEAGRGLTESDRDVLAKVGQLAEHLERTRVHEIEADAGMRDLGLEALIAEDPSDAGGQADLITLDERRKQQRARSSEIQKKSARPDDKGKQD